MKGIVWLASYPKSGNTWFRAFLANLLHDGEQPVDINTIGTANFAAVDTFDTLLGWETSELTWSEIATARLAVQESLAKTQAAVFKVHESFTEPGTGRPLFSRPATRAALYFLRNPLDVAVSFSHHRGKDVASTIALMNHSGSGFSPRGIPVGGMTIDLQLPQPMGTWSHHVRSWVDAPDLPVMVLRYEDLHVRPAEVFAAACRFAGFPHEPARVARALAHSRFEVLQQQEQTRGFQERIQSRPFFRRGRAGGWREVLSSAQVSAIIRDHGEVMRRFGYLDADGTPV